ncbi:TetR/AcrR family transcriptional regulator [Mycobacterium colombiense]|uniref:TetR/AcrR family transcriptional regulator n=1 Tax=Mycobacterium colombiense TaxID=339268 RepID=UPI00200B1E79|nr:TetR/AcrR family transcriptional regulator [Mycobacterium colombiense]MCK8642360.1 TetR/AcrR family transcriptional regulator [Mycobacterium colombiense]
MTQARRKRNARGSGSMLRDEILSATTVLIDNVAASEADITLRSIARAAGIAAPSVYAHFADLSAILSAVIERSWQEVVDQITTRADGGDLPRERLLRGCRAYVAFAQRFPLRYAMMTQASAGAPAAARSLEVLTRGLEQCCDPAHRPTRKAQARIAAGLSTALHGVAMLHRTDVPTLWLSDVSPDEVIRTIVDSAIEQQNRQSLSRSG